MFPTILYSPFCNNTHSAYIPFLLWQLLRFADDRKRIGYAFILLTFLSEDTTVVKEPSKSTMRERGHLKKISFFDVIKLSDFCLLHKILVAIPVQIKDPLRWPEKGCEHPWKNSNIASDLWAMPTRLAPPSWTRRDYECLNLPHNYTHCVIVIARFIILFCLN